MKQRGTYDETVEEQADKTKKYKLNDWDKLERKWAGWIVDNTFVRAGSSVALSCGEEGLDTLSTVLDVFGFVPVVGDMLDVVNAGILTARGKHVEAALSAISVIPIIGDAFGKGIKWTMKGAANAAEAVGKVGAATWQALVESLLRIMGDCSTAGPIKTQIMEAVNALARALGKYDIFVCFPAGTLVKTAEGDKNIEEVQPGDLVWAYDEHTGRWLLQKIEAVTVNHYRGILIVILLSDGAEIECTPEHPFYVQRGDDLAIRDIARHHSGFASAGIGRWVHADNLRVGDKLLVKEGTHATIFAVSSRPAQIDVYNLEITGHHNYAVGQTGVLVHNACSIGMTLAGSTRQEALDVLQRNGFKKVGGSPDGRFIHLEDGLGRRVEIHPPDKVTKTDHVHVIDENGNSLDQAGNIVARNSPQAHIPLK